MNPKDSKQERKAVKTLIRKGEWDAVELSRPSKTHKKSGKVTVTKKEE